MAKKRQAKKVKAVNAGDLSERCDYGKVSVLVGVKMGLPKFSSATWEISAALPLAAGESPQEGLVRVEEILDSYLETAGKDRITFLGDVLEELHETRQKIDSDHRRGRK